MATTYYVEDKHGNASFMHTTAHTAAGVITAALDALNADL